ncbi:MAG: ABC transporter substrate-binding protein [Firmicutes bacterium]|nr:ABC transporter substrate-binding protein [Bacillota bacterium]
MKKAKKFMVFILVLVMSINLISCTPAKKTGVESEGLEQGNGNGGEDIITIAASMDIATLDPYAQNATLQNALDNCIYNTLMFMDPATGEVSKELATSYEQISDIEWVFTIRDDVKFHNGEPLTASDVKFSIERSMASQGMASKVSMVDHLEVIDDHTVKFVLKYPCVTLLNTLTFCATAILNEEFVTSNGDNYVPNGTGPYKFREWKTGEHVILDRNDDYWGELHGAKTLKIVVMSEDTSRNIALEVGDIDVNINVAAVDFERIEKNDKLTLHKGINNKIDYLGLSHKDPITSNLKVRKAIAYAINKQDYIDVVLEGYGEIANSFLGKNSEGFNANQKGYPYDLDKAKELIAEAGYPGGFDLTITARSDRDNLIAQVLQGQLQEIGINVMIEIVENAVFFDKCAASTVQASFGNWAATTSDADNPLRGVLYGPNGGTNNRTWYNNPELDDLLDTAITKSDAEERKGMYYRIQEIIYEDVAIIPLFVEETGISANSNVGGIYVPVIGDIMPYYYYHWKN